MEEQLISFETAKLAKENGYNQNPALTNSAYTSPTSMNYSLKNPKYNVYVAPTQSSLQKWLREEKDIIVIIDFDYIKKRYSYSIFSSFCVNKNYRGNTYEDALEAGLEESLRLIK